MKIDLLYRGFAKPCGSHVDLSSLGNAFISPREKIIETLKLRVFRPAHGNGKIELTSETNRTERNESERAFPTAMMR